MTEKEILKRRGPRRRRRADTSLSDIIEAQPQLAPQVLETLKIGLQSEHNDKDSLIKAYAALRDVVKAQPQLAP